jgi:hypothetical protein
VDGLQCNRKDEVTTMGCFSDEATGMANQHKRHYDSLAEAHSTE